MGSRRRRGGGRFSFEVSRWLPVLGCMIYCLTIGVMHCWGNLTPYVTSYLRMKGGHRSIRYYDVHWIYAVMGVSQGMFGYFGGKLEQKVGGRVAALIGGLVMSLGLILSYFTCGDFLGLMVTLGVIFGVGSGLAYPIPLILVLKWHPDNKGLVSGLIFLARGLSVFFFTPLQTWFVNPLNEQPTKTLDEFISGTDIGTQRLGTDVYFLNDDILEKVPLLFVLLGGLFIVLQLISVAIMPSPSQDFDLALERVYPCYVGSQHATRLMVDVGASSPSDTRQSLELSPSSGRGASRVVCSGDALPILSIADILQTRQFWVIWWIMFFNWQAISFFNGFWKVIGQSEFAMADASLALLGASWAISNSAGRVVWGAIADVWGFQATMSCICFLFSAFLATIPVCHFPIYFSSTSMYFIWVNALKILDGGAFTIFPPITSDVFGKRNFGPVFGILFSARALSSLIGSLMCSVLSELFGVTVICWAMAAFTFGALLITLFVPLTPVEVEKEEEYDM